MSAIAARRPPRDLWRLLRASLLGCYLVLFTVPAPLLAVLLPLRDCVAVLSVPPWLPPVPVGRRAGRVPRAPPAAHPSRQPTP